jgi:peptide/nickel transport system substrate-binding protein
VLVAGIPEDFDVVDPHIPGGESPATWLSLIYETLVGVDKNADVTDGLATEWVISDDGLTYTFTLRDGVTFHNGETLDSSHVKWNLERIIDPETGASSQSVIAVVTSIDTPDPKTVVLNLDAPNAPLLAALAQQQRVGIMHPDSVDASGKFVQGIGTGPFTFASYATGDRLTLAANANYWGGAPRLEGIDVRIIPDATTRLNALASGDIDFAWSLPAQDAFNAAERGNFDLQENVQNRGNFFSINIDKPPFDNPKLREAMQLAVSRSDIALAGWNGYAVETAQPFNENSSWYLNRELRKDADIAAAKALVQEAGATGASVKITQWAQLGSDAEAQIVASAWTEIGLNVTIEKVSIADLIAVSVTEDWDVLYLWIGLIQDPVRAYNFLWASTGTRNGVAGGIQSEEMDSILAKAIQVSDPAERKRLYDQATQINADLFAQFYTVRPFSYVGVSKNVTGFEMGAYYVQYQGGGMTSACVPS